jgi:arabinose-5-phosphate isomerase
MEITAKGLGMTTISREGELLGIFTDGDLRRALDNRPDINEVRIGQLMSPGGRTLPEGTLAAKALGTMEQFRISSVVVTDANNHIKGVVQLLSLLKAGLA